jgi:phi LC3 family holin
MNPFMLGSVALAILGVFIDPTTKGVSDSKQAMTYTAPKAKE